MPTWSWIAGGAGAALAIAGGVLLIRGGNCTDFDLNGRCTDIISTTRLGGLLLAGSLPWLSVPLVYLLRGSPEQERYGQRIARARDPQSGRAAHLERPLLMLVWIASLIAWLCVPALVHAETALLLPPKGDDALKTERLKANVVLGDALQAQGIKVVPHSEAVAAVGGGAARECDSVDCAPALIEAASADVAAALAVWAAGDPPAPSTVFVTLVDRRGERYPGKARVEDSDLTRATKEALLDARALQLLGPGPWLRVRGKPEGAQVVLNGKLVGTLPYRAPVKLRPPDPRGPLRRPAHPRPDRRHPAQRHAPGRSRRRPRAASRGRARRQGRRKRRRPRQRHGQQDLAPIGIVGPVILGTAGLAVIIVDVAYLGSAGCSAHDSAGVCLKRDEVDKGRAIAWGAVGIAALGGALAWYLLGGSHEQSDSSMSLRVGPGSLSLHSRF